MNQFSFIRFRVFIIFAVVAMTFLLGCSDSSENTAKPLAPAIINETQNPPMQEAVEPIVAKNQKSTNKLVRNLNGFEKFKWGMSKDSTIKIARYSYGKVSSDSYAVHVEVNGNDEWFDLKFVNGKLATVMKRYNTDGKRHFADRIIRKYLKKYGQPTIETSYGEFHYRGWEGEYTKIEAENQNSDYYVNVTYTPVELEIINFSDEFMLDVWRYYINMEDKFGMDLAEAKTAKKYNITKEDVANIAVEGGKNNWPFPGESDLMQVKSEEQRKKENIEFGAELYKAAERLKNGD